MSFVISEFFLNLVGASVRSRPPGAMAFLAGEEALKFPPVGSPSGWDLDNSETCRKYHAR